MACLCTWFGIFNTYYKFWSNGVGQNRQTDEEHDEGCLAEGFSWLG